MKFFKKQQEKNVYGVHTIRELLEMIQEVMKQDSKLTLDSPVLISDFNMSGFKEEFKVHSTTSPYSNTVGLCLFHSLGEKQQVQKTETVEELEEEELELNEENMTELIQVTNRLETLSNSQREEKEPSIMKFVSRYRK